MREFPVRHRALVRYENRQLSSGAQDPPSLADFLRSHEIGNVNSKAFIDGAILPRQSIEASLHQTNAAVLYCPQIEAACLKGHDSGMVNAKDLSFSCRASHGFDRPAGAEAKLKNRIIRRDVQGRDGNAIRRPIDQTHSPSEKPAADARRLPQLLAKQNPSRLKRGHLRLTTP
jgi:hypothetical protein